MKRRTVLRLRAAITLFCMFSVSPLALAKADPASTKKAVSQCGKVSNVVGNYKPLDVRYTAGTMIVYPDNFSDRFRYAFQADDGFTSVYDVAAHVKGCTYKVISHDQNYITFRGDVLEFHHPGATGWVDSYQKIE